MEDRALPIVVFAGWNAGEDVMVHEQIAARDLTRCRNVQDLYGRRALPISRPSRDSVVAAALQPQGAAREKQGVAQAQE